MLGPSGPLVPLWSESSQISIIITYHWDNHWQKKVILALIVWEVAVHRQLAPSLRTWVKAAHHCWTCENPTSSFPFRKKMSKKKGLESHHTFWRQPMTFRPPTKLQMFLYLSLTLSGAQPLIWALGNSWEPKYSTASECCYKAWVTYRWWAAGTVPYDWHMVSPQMEAFLSTPLHRHFLPPLSLWLLSPTLLSWLMTGKRSVVIEYLKPSKISTSTLRRPHTSHWTFCWVNEQVREMWVTDYRLQSIVHQTWDAWLLFICLLK